MGHPAPLTIRSDDRTIYLAGELDASNAAACQTAIDSFQVRDGAMVIDLAELTFMDSTGLRVLVRAHQRAESAGQHVVLQRATPSIQRLLSLTGLSQLLRLTPDADSAAD